jgi:hypothetical protein
MPPVLLDVSACSDAHTDVALEALHKAIGEEPDLEGIWAEHPNPYLRRLVELFTASGLDRIERVRAELLRWLTGKGHKRAARRPRRPRLAMARWSKAELELAKLYLESIPPESLTLDDWMMVVDYITQRYLAPDDLRTEADWLVTRSAMMGRLQAELLEPPTPAAADHILARLPDPRLFMRGMTREQKAALDFGRLRCAEAVTDLSDDARRRMRNLVVDHQEAVFTGDLAGAAEALQSKILDAFGTLNRDWRRIAVTEAGENAGQGFVAAQPPGTRIKRVEQYRGACSYCRSIDGRIMTVVAADKADKDGETEVWLGKTNRGRSASPRKRLGGELVEREPEERFWVAAGTMHPHCRGAWVVVTGGAPRDATFDAWLESMAKRAPADDGD